MITSTVVEAGVGLAMLTVLAYWWTVARNGRARVGFLEGGIRWRETEMERLRGVVGVAGEQLAAAERQAEDYRQWSLRAEHALADLVEGIRLDERGLALLEDLGGLPWPEAPVEVSTVERPSAEDKFGIVMIRVEVPDLVHRLHSPGRDSRTLYVVQARDLADRISDETARRIKAALGIAAAEQME